MKYLNIRQLLSLLIGIGIILAVVYSVVGYYYLKQATAKAIEMESLNRAYVVTKQMGGLYDRIANEYEEREGEMYLALKEAQTYFEVNGRGASLEVLKAQLMQGREGSIYDVCLINRRYIIEATTYKADLGLDFHGLPKAHMVLQEVLDDPEMIDLSVVLHSGSYMNMRRYIVQHAVDGEYMVQLGLTLDRDYLEQRSILAIQKDVPTLISTESYQVFSSPRAPLDVERWWSMEFPPKAVHEIDYLKITEFFDKTIRLALDAPDDFSERAKRFRYIAEAFEANNYLDRYFWRDGVYIHWVVMPLYSRFNNYNESINLLVMEFDESASQKTLMTMSVMVTLLWLTLAGLALTVVWLVRYRIIIPLSLLQKKMSENESMPLSNMPNSRDEVGAITRAYNQLLDDLHREIYSNQVLLDQFKTFAGNAIHQIRTPLSVIKIALEMAESQNREAEQQIEASLVSIEHMYDTLSYMVQNEKVEYPPQKIDLSLLFENRIKVFNVVAEANDIAFSANITPGLHVMMNPTEAEYLIDNNLSNTIKFSKPGSVVTLSLRDSGDELILSFLNYGEAIQDVEAVFKRHVREDESKSGSGIGLNMVDTICKHNNILIQVDYANEQNQFSYFIEAM